MSFISRFGCLVAWSWLTSERCVKEVFCAVSLPIEIYLDWWGLFDDLTNRNRVQSHWQIFRTNFVESTANHVWRRNAKWIHKGNQPKIRCSNERHTSYNCASFIVQIWCSNQCFETWIQYFWFQYNLAYGAAHAKTSIDTNDFNLQVARIESATFCESMWSFHLVLAGEKLAKVLKITARCTYLFLIYLFVDPLNQSQSQLSALLSNSYREKGALRSTHGAIHRF